MCEMNQEEEEEYDDRTDERAEAGIRTVSYTHLTLPTNSRV